jgi:hypothetical protein
MYNNFTLAIQHLPILIRDTTRYALFVLFHEGSNCRSLVRRYGETLGNDELRELIATKLYPKGAVKPSEVIVSDGSKCDIGRLQLMLGPGHTVAVQVGVRELPQR